MDSLIEWFRWYLRSWAPWLSICLVRLFWGQMLFSSLTLDWSGFTRVLTSSPAYTVPTAVSEHTDPRVQWADSLPLRVLKVTAQSSEVPHRPQHHGTPRPGKDETPPSYSFVKLSGLRESLPVRRWYHLQKKLKLLKNNPCVFIKNVLFAVNTQGQNKWPPRVSLWLLKPSWSIFGLLVNSKKAWRKKNKYI